MILQAFAQWCNDPDPVPEIPHPALTPTPLVIPEGNSIQEKLCAVVQQTFPIWETDAQLRRQPACFEEMRNSYPLRNDFTAYTVPQGDSAAAILQQLGFNS
jgi:hypothetical protein